MENNDTLEVIQRIPLDKLRPYPDHPFGVRDDEMPVSFWNASPRAPITFSIEVEPSVATEPVVLVLPQPASIERARTAAIIIVIIFFISMSPFRQLVSFWFSLVQLPF